ncbi:MAG: NTPase [Desulfobacterota bacterium]|nr:NTPase [Thermodesulfobacteriota bacterium]
MVRMEKLLITGRPGVGKTTLIREVGRALRDEKPVGFYTEEIREEGERKGFELVSLDGKRRLLAHIDIEGPFRVGRYGVDLRGFEDFLDSIPWDDPSFQVILIDEIGKMECLSEKFKRIVSRLLDSEKRLIATIAMKGGGFIAGIKARKDVRIFEITPKNRNSALGEILQAFGGPKTR